MDDRGQLLLTLAHGPGRAGGPQAQGNLAAEAAQEVLAGGVGHRAHEQDKATEVVAGRSQGHADAYRPRGGQVDQRGGSGGVDAELRQLEQFPELRVTAGHPQRLSLEADVVHDAHRLGLAQRAEARHRAEEPLGRVEGPGEDQGHVEIGGDDVEHVDHLG